MITPYSIIDVVSFFPFLLLLVDKYAFGANVDPFEITVLGTIRLLTVLRLQRSIKDLPTFMRFLGSLGVDSSRVSQAQLEVARVFLSLVTLISISAGLIYEVENFVNPSIPDFFAASYFSVTTLFTVGFGDILPVTPEGRFITSVYILVSAAIIPFQLTRLGEAFLDKTAKYPGSEAIGRDEADATQPTSEQRVANPAAAARVAEPAIGQRGAAIPMADGSASEWPPGAGVSSTFKVVTCPRCGESVHVRDARFCFLCGGSL